MINGFWRMANVNRAILLILFFSPVTAYAQNARISHTVNNQAIESVLLDLAEYFGYNILINDQYFDDDQSVDLNLQNASLSESLSQVLKGSKVHFKITKDEIHLFRDKVIFGFVKNANDHEPLIGASVYLEDASAGTYTNEYGYYSFKVPFETTRIYASYIGFLPKITAIDPVDEQRLSVFLSPEKLLDEVLINPTTKEYFFSSSNYHSELLNSDIKAKLSTGGEPDINQYLFSQSGVSSGPDGLGGLHVRGGNNDQNLVLIDGVRVFQSNHALGLFSIFNTELLSKAKFSKYNFDPKFTGGVSSILDMRLREGSMKKWGGSYSLSTIASQINVDGPIIKDKWSILLSYRLSHIGVPLKLYTNYLAALEDYSADRNYILDDLNLKSTFKLNDQHKIIASFYTGSDFYNDGYGNYVEEDPYYYTNSNVKFGNQVAALRWNAILGNRWFSDVTFSYSKNYFENEYSSSFMYEADDVSSDVNEFFLTNFSSQIQEYGIRNDIEYYSRKNDVLKFGYSFHQTVFDPSAYAGIWESSSEYDIEESQDTFEIEDAYNSSEYGVYLNYDWQIAKRHFVQIGAKYSFFQSFDLFDYNDRNDHLLNGRLAYKFQFSDKLFGHVSYNRSEQGIHQLSSSNVGFPNDLWVPSVGKVAPQQVDQYNLGIELDLSSEINIRTNIFHKHMSNLIAYANDISLPNLNERSSRFWEDEVVNGQGLSRGVEFDLGYRNKSIIANLAYTISQYDRQFDGIAENERYPFTFDQRHNLSLDVNAQLTESWSVYFSGKYSGGIHQTLYETSYNFVPIETLGLDDLRPISARNGDQLPDYHRVDLGAVFKFGKKLRKELVFGIQNIYNRKNVYYRYNLGDLLLEDGTYFEAEGIQNGYALPILPTLRFSIHY